MMKAFVYEQGQFQLKEMAEPKPGPKEVLIQLKVAGLNRRDLYLSNRLGDASPALIIGSDGAGIIESVGEEVDRVRVGDEVLINPSLRWNKNSVAPPKAFDILGMPDHGTFADKIVISQEQVEPKPQYLTWEEAGVLALSALTGYRALFTKGGVQEGDTVFIPGASSGVSTYLIQFAKNCGAKVIATSRSEVKRQKAKKLGADIVLDTNSNWEEELHDETIDVVIDSIGKATFNRSLEILKKGGKMVVFGATTQDVIDLDLRKFFYGQYNLLGSTMGSREELQAMISHVEKHQTHPVVDRVFSLNNIPDAMEYLEKNNHFGKLAIQIQ